MDFWALIFSSSWIFSGSYIFLSYEPKWLAWSSHYWPGLLHQYMGLPKASWLKFLVEIALRMRRLLIKRRQGRETLNRCIGRPQDQTKLVLLTSSTYYIKYSRGKIPVKSKQLALWMMVLLTLPVHCGCKCTHTSIHQFIFQLLFKQSCWNFMTLLVRDLTVCWPKLTQFCRIVNK